MIYAHENDSGAIVIHLSADVRALFCEDAAELSVNVGRVVNLSEYVGLIMNMQLLRYAQRRCGKDQRRA
jgi:hypothetical protein